METARGGATPGENLTVGALLQAGSERLRAAGSESARLDAELLLAYVVGIDRTGVIAHSGARVSGAQAAAFDAALERRAAGEPVAYVRGIKEFYGLVFSVDPRVLIPRPETERLVELAVQRVREELTGAPRPAESEPFRIWDVGTGSGAIAVAMTATLRKRGYGGSFHLIATDVSRDALAVAVDNAVSHGVADAMDFLAADLLEADPPLPFRVDLIVANLPYIPSATVPALPVAASFEPQGALDGGPDGLAILRRLLSQLPGALAPDGQVLLEIGGDQDAAIAEAAAALLPGWIVTIHSDLSGAPRVAQLDPPVATQTPTSASMSDAQVPPGRG